VTALFSARFKAFGPSSSTGLPLVISSPLKCLKVRLKIFTHSTVKYSACTGSGAQELCLPWHPCPGAWEQDQHRCRAGEEGRELRPSQPGPGWTWREGEVQCWEALPRAPYPDVPSGSGAKFKLLAVPGQALQPSRPLLLRPCPHHPPLTAQGTIATAANSGPELSTAEQVNQRRDEDKHSKKGSLRPKARALSGIKSPCAGVKQALAESVAINPSSPICKKGVGRPYVCHGTLCVPCPCSPSVLPGGDESWICPHSRARTSPTPVGAGPRAAGPTIPASCGPWLPSPPLPTQPLACRQGAKWGREHRSHPPRTASANPAAPMPRGPAPLYPAHRQPALRGLGLCRAASLPFTPPARSSAATKTQSGFSFSPLLSLGR